MRYRKENGQWLPTTPLGVSREEFDEVKQDLTHFVGGDEWTQRTYNKGEVCIHNNIAWECLATTTVEPSASATSYWKAISLKELNGKIKSLVKKKVGNITTNAYGTASIASLVNASTDVIISINSNITIENTGVEVIPTKLSGAWWVCVKKFNAVAEPLVKSTQVPLEIYYISESDVSN